MKIWLAKNSEIPVREQLVTQIMLGVVSGDLAVGKRLPSTKEISNRFGIHTNTVSAAYQKLAEQGWLEFRKGSGFYVCAFENQNLSDDLKLEKLIADFLQNALKLGFTSHEIKERLNRNLDARAGAKKILLIESEIALRDILVEELRAAGLEIEAIANDDFARKAEQYPHSNAVVAAMIDEKTQLEKLLSPGQRAVFLKTRSIPASLTGERRPADDELIAVVSAWEKFLIWSKTILLAAEVPPESLVMRRRNDQANWRNGLKAASLIICDALTAATLGDDPRVRIFRIISDESIGELIRFTDTKSALI